MKRKENKKVSLLTEISDGGGNQKFSVFLLFFNLKNFLAALCLCCCGQAFSNSGV